MSILLKLGKWVPCGQVTCLRSHIKTVVLLRRGSWTFSHPNVCPGKGIYLHYNSELLYIPTYHIPITHDYNLSIPDVSPHNPSYDFLSMLTIRVILHLTVILKVRASAYDFPSSSFNFHILKPGSKEHHVRSII